MVKPVFSVCVYNWKDNACGPTADLDLPATGYEIEDALQKVREGEGGETMVSVGSCGEFQFLRSHIGEAENLRTLNALTEKLAMMDGWQIDALRGLVRIDEKNEVEINLPRLYDLASSVDSCQVLYDVKDYVSLGRFYAENDFVPELEDLRDEVWELLSYDIIGRRMAAQENGAFIGDRGYVVRTGEVQEKFKTLDFTPKKPDYTALLEVSIRDTGESVSLKLPCGRENLDRVLTQLKADGWSGLSWRCADCRVPALRDAFSWTDNIVFANLAARRLAEMSTEDLIPYKALVEASRCSDLADAVKLTEGMDAYIFTRKYERPEDVALDELAFLLREPDRESLRPFVDLHRYGERLIEEQNISLTPYGGIERKDRQPIHEVCHEPEMGGMTMM